jgi:hypothetical protein
MEFFTQNIFPWDSDNTWVEITFEASLNRQKFCKLNFYEQSKKFQREENFYLDEKVCEKLSENTCQRSF